MEIVYANDNQRELEWLYYVRKNKLSEKINFKTKLLQETKNDII